MHAQPATRRTGTDAVEIGARLVAVALALGTAYIHSTLGGLMFTLNAIGFATLAVALVAPIRLFLPERYARPLRLLARLGLLGFAALTIGGWLLFGARYSTGYLATGIEVLIVLVASFDIVRAVGGPVSVARELLRLVPARARTTAA